MDLKIKCSECTEVFNTKDAVKQKAVRVQITGEELKLIYYVCPKCGCERVVQLDDKSTEELLMEYKQLMFRKVLQKRRGKDLNKKSQKRMNELQQKLKDMRYDLAIKHHGAPVIDSNNNAGFLDTSYIKEAKDGKHESCDKL